MKSKTKSKKNKSETSVITKLSKAQKFYVTLIARLLDEFVKEEIITPTQNKQCSEYILNKMQIK